MVKLKLQIIILLLLSVSIFSCDQDEKHNDIVDKKNDENFVNLDEVHSIASLIEFPVTTKNSNNLKSNLVTTSSKEIESINEITDRDGIASCYIINYKSEGFIIVAADNRVAPILAYSESQKFPLGSEEYPNGLVDWLEETKDYINGVRLLDNKSTEQDVKEWSTCKIQKIIGPIEGCNPDDEICDPPIEGCEDRHSIVSPLLSTNWGQGTGFNNLVPLTGCSGYYNGRAPTGCVATAMAQIIRFHEYPNDYNYSIMPNEIGYSNQNSNGGNEIAKLMRDIGKSVHMDYGCGGSGANSKDVICPSFINDFGYSSASRRGYNSDIIKQQLSWGQPVILTGGRKSGSWILPSYKNGHAWVCDGYNSTFYCNTGASYLYLHMNWGWGRDNLNGWFAYNNWRVDDKSFNYKKTMYYNIKP